MLRNKSLAFRLSLILLTATTIIYFFVLAYNYYILRDILYKNAEENSKNLSSSTINRIQGVLFSVEKIANGLKIYLENSPFSKKDLNEMLYSTVANNNEIFACCVSFEPHAFIKDSFYYNPNYYKKNNKILLDNDYEEYIYLDWYQIPKILDQPIWSEPYYEEGVIMSTYSVPFYDWSKGKKILKGIVTVDVDLSRLQKKVSSIKILESGYGLLISKSGTIITHPRENWIMNESLFSIADEYNVKDLRENARKMIKGESGFVPSITVAGLKCYLCYAPLSSNGWSLGLILPQDELFADLNNFTRILVLVGIFGFILLFGLIILISKNITKPIHNLVKVTEQIGLGNLDAQLPIIKYNDEIGKLNGSFKFMQNSLKEYIVNLKATTAAKERFESELGIAHQIQNSMLPKIFPPFPDRKELDVYAIMNPAKEVGGDFYDFFLVDEERLCLVIGDVSGKGVPAALFMVITKILLKNQVQQGLSPAEALYQVNNIICAENTESMFVTIFCAILDLKTGNLEYSNAGHNPPILLKNNCEYELIKGHRNFIVGGIEGFKYDSNFIKLNPGEIIFLYTDGVTEAMNSEGKLFSEERLNNVLKEIQNKEAREIINKVLLEINGFVKDSPQYDDITMLSVKYN